MKPYVLGIYEKAMPNTLSWSEKLDYGKDFGFDFLEMSIDESEEKRQRLQMTKEDRQNLAGLILEKDFPIGSICLSAHRKFPLGSKDPKTQTYALEIMEKALFLAKDLGIRLVQLAGYDVYYEPSDTKTQKIFLANLKTACEMASTLGICLGFETMEATHKPFMDTVTKAMSYVQKVNIPYLGVYPDIGNLKNASVHYGTDFLEDLYAGHGHIFAAHLKETIPGHYREIPFSTGHTEYIPGITALKEMGVRRYVGEFWYTGQEHWMDICRDANVFLRAQLDQVFL